MARYRSYKHPVTHRSTKRRHKSMGDLGLDFSVAQKGLTASVDAVKSVGMVAVVAAAGAIATDYIFSSFLLDSKDKTKNIIGFKIDSMETDIAKGVVGIAGGLMIGKFMKKEKLGAAFAIGAVALAVYNIAQRSLKLGKYASTTAELGYISARNARGFSPAALGASRVTDTSQFQPMPVPAVSGYY